MRIDLNNSIARQIAAERSAKPKESSTSSTSAREDKTSFSQSGLSIASLVQGAMSPSAARQERVAALREAIENGNYKPDPSAMAKAMIEEAGK